MAYQNKRNSGKLELGKKKKKETPKDKKSKMTKQVLSMLSGAPPPRPSQIPEEELEA